MSLITRSISSPINRAWYAVKAATRQQVVALVTSVFPYGIQATYYERTFDNYVRQGYRRNSIVYACVRATADTTAQTSLMVHNKATNEVLDNHALRSLITNPNPVMSEFDLWSTAITHMKLAGVSYWQKIRNGVGQVVQLWPMRPDYVKPVIDGTKGLIAYDFSIDGVLVDTIPAEDVIRIPLPDPLNIFQTLSPIEVLAREADVDNSLTDFIKMMLERGAIPQGILVSKMKLTSDQIERIRERWTNRYAGFRELGTPAVLDGNDMSYQKIGLALNEMVFNDIDARSEARICQVLDVPPIIIGATVGLARSTFSNYGEARRQWWEDKLMPVYTRLANVVNAQLAADFGQDIICRWDFSKVPALQEERTARWTRATQAFKAGVITRNMALNEMGLENVGAEGDVFIQSTLETTVPDDRSDNMPADTIAPDESEDESVEGKAIASDEQSKWFFANNPQFAKQGTMPTFKEGGSGERGTLDKTVAGSGGGSRDKFVSAAAADFRAMRLEWNSAKSADIKTIEVKSEPADKVKPDGKPLPQGEATDVKPFEKTEIDEMFDLYKKLSKSKNGKKEKANAA